jgi:NAD(P)-dependent dehydrogenase (short-subunit alcohol dehydrogenase family)
MRAGDRIVATSGKRSAISEKLGPDSGSLLSVQLDVTDVVQVRAAVREAVNRFGGMGVLMNQAGCKAARNLLRHYNIISSWD